MVQHPKAFDHVGLLFNDPPAKPGCSSSRHPTSVDCKAQNGDCNTQNLRKDRKSFHGCYFVKTFSRLSTSSRIVAATLLYCW